MKKRITDGEIMPAETENSKKSSHKVSTAVITVVASVVLLAFYYLSLGFEPFPGYFMIVMWVYMVALAALALTYVIYNRGFSRKGITAQMLPDEWSDEQKQDFIEDGEKRMRRSKWMLVLIVAFFVTFAVEALYLFVYDTMLEGLLGLL